MASPRSARIALYQLDIGFCPMRSMWNYRKERKARKEILEDEVLCVLCGRGSLLEWLCS